MAGPGQHLVGRSKTGHDRLEGNTASQFRRARLRALTILSYSVYVASCGSEATAHLKTSHANMSVAKVTDPYIGWIDQSMGGVEAPASVTLRPRVSGSIERVLFEEGREVRAGDVLFVIGQPIQLAAIARAITELERIRAQAIETRREATQARRLLETRAISQEEHDARITVDERVDAALRAAEATVEAALLELELTEVRAPISGRAGRAFVTEGDLVIASETTLVQIISMAPLYV